MISRVILLFLFVLVCSKIPPKAALLWNVLEVVVVLAFARGAWPIVVPMRISTLGAVRTAIRLRAINFMRRWKNSKSAIARVANDLHRRI